MSRTTAHLWDGIDPATRAFCDWLVRLNLLRNCQITDARDWLRSCVDAGVSTSLDADFDEPKMAKLLELQLTYACFPGLKRTRLYHIEHLRHGLRIYYFAAQPQFALRTRPVPPVATVIARRCPVSAAQARAMLPADEQQKLKRIDEMIRACAVRQWTGRRAKLRLGEDGRRHKATVSLSHGEQLIDTMNDLLQHGAVSGVSPFTLDALLTKEHVVKFLYYSKRYDGGLFARRSIKNREWCLPDYIYRGRAGRPQAVELITPEREQEIRAAIKKEQAHADEWWAAPDELSNSGDSKFYPTLDQVRLAITALEEEIALAEDALARGRMTRKRAWRQIRDAVMTLCAIYGMWRVDTVATISLLQIRRDPVTLAVTDRNGFLTIENIVRAKNTKGDWYPFVPALVLPANAVALIEKLLKLEGRSLAQPLKPGEQPVRLKAGQKWGANRIPQGELTVVPLFRKHPDRPEGLGHTAIRVCLMKSLMRRHFGATNPHTLRSTGAIYWTFIQQMPEHLVMQLGLWEDVTTLRENYARITEADKVAAMAAYVPPDTGSVPVKARGHREEAAAAAVRELSKLLEKATNPFEARRHLGEVRRQLEEVDQTIASDLGLVWEPLRPDRFADGEVERIDAALKGAGYAQGIRSVLGRDVLASDALRTQAENVMKQDVPPVALRRLRNLLQLRSEAGEQHAQHEDEQDDGEADEASA